MKRLTVLLASALLATLPLFAQDKAPTLRATPSDTPREPGAAEDDRLELIPTKPAQIMPPPAGLPLIPEIPMPPPPPSRSRSEAPVRKRDSATADAEEAVKQRIRIREVKTKAQRDPAVQAEWDRAQAQRTDFEKREAMKNYYRLLYGRMAKIDPTLKAPVNTLLQQSLARLDQTRIAPTPAPSAIAGGPRAER
jgi:hypothetical protein